LNADRVVLDTEGLQQLFDLLVKQGYSLIGPTIREEAILYDHVRTVADLPVGWTDEQEGGSYRLKKSDDESIFNYAVGPQSWKRFLFPPVARLWQANRKTKKIETVGEEHQAKKYALIGVRSCEIHAIAIQDKVFLKGEYSDLEYRARRESALVVAVNCSHASSNCFCASMQTGPRAKFGYDLAMTEVLANGSHYFLVDIGSERGASIMDLISHRTATEAESKAADQVSEAVEIRKVLDTTDIRGLLYRNYENPRWIEVANRCLTCGNCTLVCPTCFCTTVYEATDLAGRHVERWRRWDSCFNVDFSYIHGGSIRSSPMSRYRQWMTHKLATWIDQFGTSGCVGCGRCITWCPVGIDITEESRAIRESEKKSIIQTGGMEVANA
jgi:sulfhydrogenase subunit beta (sulfur reductase)